jgi:hypothetical protein
VGEELVVKPPPGPRPAYTDHMRAVGPASTRIAQLVSVAVERDFTPGCIAKLMSDMRQVGTLRGVDRASLPGCGAATDSGFSEQAEAVIGSVFNKGETDAVAFWL